MACDVSEGKLYRSIPSTEYPLHIDPDVLISLISEEYEWQKVQHLHCSNGKSPKDNDRDEAMTASSSKGGKAGGHNHRFPCGTCWNCGDKGHFKDKCPKPQKQNDGKEAKDSQKGGSANAAVGVDSDSEGEGAFAAVAVEDYELDDSMPNLKAVSDSDSDNEPTSGVVVDNNWFSDATDEGVRGSECSEGSD